MIQVRSGGRRVQIAAMSLFLCLGMLLACFFPAPRSFAEEEVESSPATICLLQTHTCATRSPLVRLPAPLVVRAQGRAVERGTQTRHDNNELSKRNGTGSHLLI